MIQNKHILFRVGLSSSQSNVRGQLVVRAGKERTACPVLAYPRMPGARWGAGAEGQQAPQHRSR